MDKGPDNQGGFAKGYFGYGIAVLLVCWCLSVACCAILAVLAFAKVWQNTWLNRVNVVVCWGKCRVTQFLLVEILSSYVENDVLVGLISIAGVSFRNQRHTEWSASLTE